MPVRGLGDISGSCCSIPREQLGFPRGVYAATDTPRQAGSSSREGEDPSGAGQGGRVRPGVRSGAGAARECSGGRNSLSARNENAAGAGAWPGRPSLRGAGAAASCPSVRPPPGRPPPRGLPRDTAGAPATPACGGDAASGPPHLGAVRAPARARWANRAAAAAANTSRASKCTSSFRGGRSHEAPTHYLHESPKHKSRPFVNGTHIPTLKT